MQRCLAWMAVAVVVAGGGCEPLLRVSNAPHNTLTLDPITMHFVHAQGEAHVRWGLTLPEDAEGVPCGEGDSCLDFGVAKVVVSVEDHCQKVSWTAAEGGLAELQDCVLLEGHWFGGGEQVKQPWPLEKQPRKETAFVTSDMLQKRNQWYGGVTEAYWVSSQGVAVKVEEQTPLFLSVPDTDDDSTADELCLSARHQPPFVAAPGSPLTLTYFLCSADDVRKVHEATFPKFFSLPEATPDARMIRDPVWSTWAEYHKHVNDSRVLDFARAVSQHGFNNSQVEIDDDWETCYGEAVFKPDSFPDPRGLVDQLHSEGFRVTLWVHPFINNNCPAFTLADQQGYLAKDSSGSTQLTHWWDGTKAGIVDFTNAEAAAWWAQRLLDLQQDTGIDSFKFDAGEASWLPENYTLQADETFWPNIYTMKYVETAAKFGNMIEVRVGHRTQHLPVFVRMLDKDSNWSYENGLKTLVPSFCILMKPTFLPGLLGYPFVLPDMIGGNAYVLRPSKELFVRWAQANAFMPALQFSILPWDYDEEVTELCQEVTRLHAEFAPLLLNLAEEATVSVAPMMRPTWWLCPTLEDCLTADQQFLVGDDLLVAPVVKHIDADTLDVVLPPGEWKQAGTGLVGSGPGTITVANITLDSIVYFTRVTS
ncbi:Myogenesis-regulating glycosidase [Chionoecetes opilio]|uniref:Myogenesis-regulating glycosidase n=1 Tax=Chionoecetes opilio TaxID=41210 RepID=A0A8J4YF76_CHIOP|nr:Myogenesis-regulating glycosidase [Chionoecetes opilio]